MKEEKKLMYTTIRMDAYTIIQFMLKENFWDKELEDKLAILIEKVNEYLENE